MTFLRVCSFDDLWEGEMKVFTVNGTEVLLVHLKGGHVTATQVVCPHQNVELVEGTLEGDILTCRMHLWQFNVRTCIGHNPTHTQIASYPTQIQGDEIFVDVNGDVPKFATP